LFGVKEEFAKRGSHMNGAPLRVLYIGGTGIISASCVRRSVAEGMEVFVLNRGVNAKERALPEAVKCLVADHSVRGSVAAAIADLRFDAVVNFQVFDSEGALAAIEAYRGKTSHYIHISTASLYRKPILQVPIVESNLRRNAFVKYSRDKIEAEDRFMDAFLGDGFPITIVRPTHTYDETNPPLPGDWTILERMERGAEIVVPGDGTSLWTLTHAADFAQGLVGLIANPRALGEAFHITSDDLYTWDQIYAIIGAALGVEVKLVHVPSELILVGAPDWFWSELIIGDLAHSAIFDNTKIRQYVPGYQPRISFYRAIHSIVDWRRAHPVAAAADPTVNAILDRLVTGYRGSRDLFASLAARDSR
jgi:nucleoside-diphosphate-sugar epimerase